MKINKKDILLADFMEGNISKADLLAKYPELREEIELIKLSINALEKLEPAEPEKTININSNISLLVRIPKTAWYAAAAILIVVSLSLFITGNDSINTTVNNYIISEKTEVKIIDLWRFERIERIDQKQQELLLNLALYDQNSNIRYMALQKLIDQPLFLQEIKLYQFASNENNATNQTAWIDLWIKLHADTKGLKKWLNKSDLDPLVKTYAETEIKNI